jgi:hypothetical protein
MRQNSRTLNSGAFQLHQSPGLSLAAVEITEGSSGRMQFSWQLVQFFFETAQPLVEHAAVLAFS